MHDIVQTDYNDKKMQWRLPNEANPYNLNAEKPEYLKMEDPWFL